MPVGKFRAKWLNWYRTTSELSALGIVSIEYYKKVLSLAGSSINGYWPMWEGSGSVSEDISSQGNTGAYTGVELGQAGIGDGRSCPLFDGTNDFNNVYSAGLDADFSNAEGTLAICGKVSAAGVWTDAAIRNLFSLAADGANFIEMRKGGPTIP